MRREYEALNKLIGRNFAVLNDGMGVYLTPKGEIRDIDGRLLLPELEGRARLFERNLAESGKGGGTSDAVQYIPQELTEEQQMQARANIGLDKTGNGYSQLVTDKNGNAVWDKRLAWDYTEEVTPLDNVTFETTGEGTPYIIDSPFNVTEGSVCKVLFDGDSYECPVYIMFGSPTIGNSTIMGQSEGNGEPFFVTDVGDSTLIATTETGTHTISVVADVHLQRTIEERYIPTIPESKLPTIPESKLPTIPESKLPERTLLWDTVAYSEPIIKFDGVLTETTMLPNSMRYCLVSEEPFQVDFNKTYITRRVHTDGRIQQLKEKPKQGTNCINIGYVCIVESAGSITWPDMPITVTAPKAGVYFQCLEGGTYGIDIALADEEDVKNGAGCQEEIILQSGMKKFMLRVDDNGELSTVEVVPLV